MLIRNCDLLEHGDINVRTSIFDKNPRYHVALAYKLAWLEFIKDCLGGGIIHSNTKYSFTIKKPGQRSSYLYTGTGLELMKKLDSIFQKPTSIRINILGDSIRSWIIIIPDINNKTNN